MSARNESRGLTAAIKDRLIQESLQRRLRRLEEERARDEESQAAGPLASAGSVVSVEPHAPPEDPVPGITVTIYLLSFE